MVDCDVKQSWAAELADHGDVLGAIVVDVEMLARLVTVEDADFDHETLRSGDHTPETTLKK